MLSQIFIATKMKKIKLMAERFYLFIIFTLHLKLSMQDYNEQKFQETIKSLVDATETDLDRPLTLDELKELALSMGMTDSEWANLLRQADKDLDTAELHLKARNYVDAVSFADKATAVNPYIKDGHSILAQSYLMQFMDDHDENKREKAEFYARKAIKINPNDKRAINVLSTIQNKKRISGNDSKIKKYVLIGAGVIILLVLLGMFTVGGSDGVFGGSNIENQLIDAEENANQKWGDLQAAMDRRDQLIPDLLTALGQTNTALNNQINKLRDQIKAAEGQKKIDLQKQLDDKVAEAKLYLTDGPEKSDIVVEIEGAENRIRFARKEYNKAVKDYNVLVKKNKADFPQYETKNYFE